MKVIYPHVEPVLRRLLVQVVTRVRIQGYAYSRFQSDITRELENPLLPQRND
jgi:hypothetical protein